MRHHLRISNGCLTISLLAMACGELEIAKLPQDESSNGVAGSRHTSGVGGNRTGSNSSASGVGGSRTGSNSFASGGAESQLSSSQVDVASGGLGGVSSRDIVANGGVVTEPSSSSAGMSSGGSGGASASVVVTLGGSSRIGSGGEASTLSQAVGGSSTVVTAPKCPWPEKSTLLRNNEPTPVDPCARPSVVTRLNNSPNYVWGFSNGELYYQSSDGSYTSIQTWSDGAGGSYSLPSAPITAIASLFANYEGAFEVGYLDPLGTLKNLWYVGQLGRSWFNSHVGRTGTILSLWYCPSHIGGMHRSARVWDYCLDSTDGGQNYPGNSSCDALNHLGLEDYPTYISVSTVSEVGTEWSRRLYVGTTSGLILRSNVYDGQLVFDETTSKLTVKLAWEEVTDANMPSRPVLNITSHPNKLSQLFVTFASQNSDGIWLSKDEGIHWENRHGSGLPVSTRRDKESIIIRASFHPSVDGVAYVVTPSGAYYTEDEGHTWLP